MESIVIVPHMVYTHKDSNRVEKPDDTPRYVPFLFIAFVILVIIISNKLSKKPWDSQG